MKNIAVFISGRGSNFINIHKNILSGNIHNAKISLVFSNKSDAEGLQYARENNIKQLIISPKDFSDRSDYDRHIVNELASYDIGLICLAGYMRIVTDVLITAYPNKIINIHPSLLPSFPGLHAQKQAIDYGSKYSGCTVHFVDTGVDTGMVIMQSVVNILDDDDESSLSAKILKEEHKIYPKVVDLFCNDKLRITSRRIFVI